ncbi:heavy metal-associated domain-containing protein [Undibacterium sp. RTI2.1]|uniref:heavy-metal-associated domain-containing protein n=1 Tax=unclassified Undibacterium TaxID=2630295 RepID=UPI002AB599D6|nr:MULTISPECIES: heavy metal-associated domain-containing protein [unclassified Undibacterium]MDY7537409.1 heavy metal-associated domain-containing protein [Undibacterium sp. 5I1]MEB0031206.1 heavy metal-associated domain-containing protein [Undibacterium sp. RTI2.1]MEB0117586.1 heavy metal-associated domain-containing protein [Undibacterium sp. RTI2.2]MEB0232279.1 heavy metal-associated domain-containing protein [Undibacterium sp. 10I3]MEB0259793.1 heavy metal-associated domain-containing pro
METMIFDIQGMTSGACLGHIYRALEGMDGVSDTELSLRDGQAIVSTDPTCVTASQVEEVIERLGYHANIHLA